jgi:hydrogenase nickel incorporation protein HypA/HybF
MHEFSLAQGLHGQLLDLARSHQAGRILAAEIRVGDGAGIVLDSFLFGFQVLAEEDPTTRGMDLTVSHDTGSDLILMRVELL